MELIFSRRVRYDPTGWSFNFNCDEQVFWYLNFHLPMCISQAITYLNPKLSALVWVCQWFSILFINHKPCPNSIITTSPELSVKEVTPVHIRTLICSACSGRNGYTFQSSKVNDISLKLAPKQWIPAWFSISVADVLQITLSWFLYFIIYPVVACIDVK